jgi:ABC-2 type transport system ATP-binding protein
MDPVLAITNACKRFGGTQALNGAHLTLRRGELLLLLGPNGAGKTTLVRSVAGRVRLDSGQITLLGHALDGHNATARRQLGIVPQEIALYSLLTPRENLEVFGQLNGLGAAALRERVEWALAWTGLEERAGEPIRGFSGGMKRRLNIACGVLHQPEVVLLDEPTVGVDPQSRERIWEMLDRLREAGTSLLLTTHQLDEAQARSDHIVIIDHGRTIADGTLTELIEKSVGSHRRIVLTLDRPAPKELGAGEDHTVRFPVLDVVEEIPVLLEKVQAHGCRVEDLRIEAPSLHSVFLSLTGRELRE